jgi:hypothetical protein
VQYGFDKKRRKKGKLPLCKYRRCHVAFGGVSRIW